MQHEIITRLFNAQGNLPEEVVESIVALVEENQLKKGEYFIREGAVMDRLAVITKGCMRYFYLKDGEEITGEFWQEGELAGSYESSILEKPSSLYIEAIEDTSILVLSYKSLKALAETYPVINKTIILLLERFIVESQLRIASYITETPEQRYLRLREEMPGIEDRVHQKYIASFVGVTPVTLSRIRARLAQRQS